MKELIKVGLVEEVGQRVVKDKKATEKLFALKSRIVSSEDIKNWESEDRQWILRSTMEILAYLHPELGEFNVSKLQQFRVDITKLEVELNKKLSRYQDKVIVKKLYQYNWKDFWLIYTTLLDFYIYLTYPNLLETFTSCLT